MSELVNQARHRLYSGQFFEHDYLNRLKGLSKERIVERVAVAVLPIIARHQSLSPYFSLGANTIQVLAEVSDLGFLIYHGELSAIPLGLLKTSVAVTCLSFTLFESKLGNLITTGSSLVFQAGDLVSALKTQESEKIFKVLSRLVVSSLYLSLLLTGSLEIGLVCMLFQAAIALLESRQEFNKGRWIEALSLCVQAGLKGRDAWGQCELIERKNTLMKLTKFQKLIEQLYKARQIGHFNTTHPLMNLDTQLEAQSPDGAYFFGLGEDVVKGMNLEFQDIEGQIKLDFNINHEKREALLSVVDHLESLDKKELKELLNFFDLPIEELKIRKFQCPFEESYKWFQNPPQISQEDESYCFECVEVIFKGLGLFRIGYSDEYWFMRTHVQILLEAGKNLYDLHTALCVLGLDTALRLSSPQMLERMKIGHLFRMFYPKIAHAFEITQEYFTLGLDELKAKIIALVPDMKGIFTRYLSSMQLYELFPGMYRYQIVGLKQELQKRGALGLTTTLYVDYESSSKFDPVVFILKQGLTSSETRHAHGEKTRGLSPDADRYEGGSDSVFAQLLTTSDKKYTQLSYNSSIRFLIDLKAVETGTYQYPKDKFGERRREPDSSYNSSLGIYQFVETMRQQKKQNWGNSNEIMIKQKVDPSLIIGMVLDSEKTKSSLIDLLRKEHLITSDPSGVEYILGKRVSQFFHVTDAIEIEPFG